MAKFGIGQAIRRTEDLKLLIGEGQYTADVTWPGQAHGVAVRSPHAHAKILSIDIADAKAGPGVLDVFTGAEMRADGLGPIPNNYPLKQTDGSPLIEPPAHALATDKVRHIGDPVAFVVAETLEQAKDAAELVYVDYEDLPSATDLATADADDAPQIWDEAPNNRSFTWDHGDEAATDAAFAKAAHTVTLRLINNRIVVNAMEPRAALGAYDAAEDRYALHTPTQGVHSMQRQMADNIFKVDTSQMRVITGHVGGGFGMKIFVYPEQVCVLYAAKRIGRPVKWVGERSYDGFVADKHGRDHVSDITLSLDETLRFTGLRVVTKANLGAYISGFQPFIPTLCGAKMLSGVYAIPAIHNRVYGLITNTTPVDAYRGAGRPEVAYLIERLVDKAAHDLGIEPVELRRRNYIPVEAMPYTTPVGPVYDSGDFHRLTDMALERADAAGFAARRAASEAKGKLRGMGMAFYIECCGAGPGEQADMRVAADGSITLYIGTQDNGQGHHTAYKQIISERLGIDLDKVTVIQGDTDLVERGGGTGGSRSIPEGGVAVRDAADGVIEKGKLIAGALLEAAPGDIDYADGAFAITGTDRRIGFEDVAARAHEPGLLPPDMPPGLDVKTRHKAEAQTFPNGCHVCEIEIDLETGAPKIARYVVVDDFGTVVNPLMLAGQVHGGIAQGVGQALLEETIYDPESGQLLSGSFMDYCMPRADDMPDIDFSYVEDIPCVTNPLGIKGAGEAGAIGAPPACINALVDALKPYGVHHIDMPATQSRLWQILQAARPARAAE
jgi:carbon-monoxide dehydrogenase large subunit